MPTTSWMSFLRLAPPGRREKDAAGEAVDARIQLLGQIRRGATLHPGLEIKRIVRFMK